VLVGALIVVESIAADRVPAPLAASNIGWSFALA